MDRVLGLDDAGGNNIDIASSDDLRLYFLVPGCFKASEPNFFNPPLPEGDMLVGPSGPHYPKYPNHDVTYSFDPRNSCPHLEHEYEKAHPEHRRRIFGMHTIHTGN